MSVCISQPGEVPTKMTLSRFLASALIALGLVSLARAEVRIVGNLSGAFVDTSSFGTRLNLGDDGAQPINTSIGNSLLPPGIIHISNNGVVAWRNTNTPAFTNDTIPSANLCGGAQALAVYWDDLLTVDRSPPAINDGVY